LFFLSSKSRSANVEVSNKGFAKSWLIAVSVAMFNHKFVKHITKKTWFN